MQVARDSDSECKMTLSDAEEEMKQMKLSDEPTLKSESKQMKKTKKRKKKNGQDQKTPLKEVVTVSDNAGTGDDQDLKNSIEQKKKKKRKKKHFDDPVSATETTSNDDLQFERCTDVDQFSGAQDFDGEYFHRSCKSAVEQLLSHEMTGNVEDEVLSNLSPMEGEEKDGYKDTIGSLEETMTESVDQTVTEGDQMMSLMPLGREGKSMSSMAEGKKKSVRRQLPEWITDADIIPDDIIEQSR